MKITNIGSMVEGIKPVINRANVGRYEIMLTHTTNMYPVTKVCVFWSLFYIRLYPYLKAITIKFYSGISGLT